jgi:tetratricopeptide (TPR) repeat protein
MTSEEERRRFIQATVIVGGFFVLSAFLTSEWILILVGIFPPLITFFLVGGRLGRPPAGESAQESQPMTLPQALEGARKAPEQPQSPGAQLAKLDARLEADRKNGRLLVQRAGVLISQGDYNEALHDLNLAVYYEPELAMAHALRGNISLRRGDWQGARQYFDRAIALDGNLARAYAERAYTFILDRDFEKADADCRVALDLVRDYYLAHSNLALIALLQGDMAAAKAAIARASASNRSGDPGVMLLDAVILARSGEQTEAEAQWRALMAKSPAYASYDDIVSRFTWPEAVLTTVRALIDATPGDALTSP